MFCPSILKAKNLPQITENIRSGKVPNHHNYSLVDFERSSHDSNKCEIEKCVFCPQPKNVASKKEFFITSLNLEAREDKKSCV